MSSSNMITYFCCDSECSREVAHYGAPCCLEHNPLVEWYDEDDISSWTESTIYQECDGTRCCDGNPMCRDCASEYNEPCRGCGVYCLPSPEGYCMPCYDDRFMPPPVAKRGLSIEELQELIKEIEERIRSPQAMTKGQRDDWIWILQNRRADLAELMRSV